MSTERYPPGASRIFFILLTDAPPKARPSAFLRTRASNGAAKRLIRRAAATLKVHHRKTPRCGGWSMPWSTTVGTIWLGTTRRNSGMSSRCRLPRRSSRGATKPVAEWARKRLCLLLPSLHSRRLVAWPFRCAPGPSCPDGVWARRMPRSPLWLFACPCLWCYNLSSSAGAKVACTY